MMGLWSTVQQAASIFCCCVITYKPLFTQMGTLGIFSRLSSWFAANRSRSQQSQGNKSDMDLPPDVSHGWIDLEDPRDTQRCFVSTKVVASKPESRASDGKFSMDRILGISQR